MNRKINKRPLVLLVCLALCLVVAVGGTLAFLIAQSGSISNIFNPSKVSCTVSRGNDNTFTVTNNGDIDAYIRVAVVATWVNNETKNVSAVKPNVVIDLAAAGNWFEGSDGYYYYKLPVSKNAVTDVFSVDLSQVGSQTGYYLNVEVVASAIQATSDAVAAWSDAVTIGDDGKLTAKN